MSVHNLGKNTIVPIHNNKRAESTHSGRSRHHPRHPHQNGSPKMSLFSWLEFEKASQVGSIASERPTSQLSNFSGLSGVDEFFVIGNGNRAETVDSGTYSLDTFQQRASSTDYQKIITELNKELLSAKTANIQLKFKLDETAALHEMEWTEKVRRLSNENRIILEQKMNTDKVNEELKSQLALLKRNRSTACDDNEVNELKMKIELLEHDRQKDELELFQNKNLIADLQIMLETKEKSSQSIKEQMIDIHAKNQDLVLKIKRMENETSTMMNEIEMLKKSESWYKHELHECQSKKLKLQEDFMTSKNELQLEKNKNSRLYAEFTQLLRNCEDIEAKAIREKESMMRKLENIQANLGASMDKNHLINHVKDVYDKQAAMLQVDEAKKELFHTQKKCEQQEALIKQMEQKHKSYVSNEASLQKQISELTQQISLHESKTKELEEIISGLEGQRNTLTFQNQDLRAEHEKLLVHYEAMSKEKSKIDETVLKLREDCEVIMSRFEHISQELAEKEALVSSLTFENKLLQEKSKDENALKNLVTENQLLKSDLLMCETKVASQNDEISQSKRELKQKDAEITELKNKIEIKRQEIDLLTESNQLSKQEVSQMINQLQSTFNELKLKNAKISSLLDMNQSIEKDFKAMKTVMDDLQISLEKITKERNCLREELGQAYDVIEKHSEQQKFNEKPKIQATTVEKGVCCDFLSHEIDSLKAEIEIMKTDYIEKLSKSESQSKCLTKKLKEEMKQRYFVEQNANDKNDLALSNAELQAKLDLCTNKSTILEAKCTNLQTEVDKLEDERLNLITYMKDNNLLQGDDVILSLIHLNDQIGILNQKIFETEDALKKTNVELSHKQHDFMTLQKENESIKAHLKSISSSAASIANYEAQLIQLQSAIDAKTAENETLNKELLSLHNQIKNITATCDELKLNLVTASSQNIELSDTINDLKNQLHSNGLEIQLLEEKCESFKNIERNLIQSKDQLVREMQQLRKELSLEHSEKLDLQKLTTELKFALSQLMDSAAPSTASITNGKDSAPSSPGKSLPSITRRTDFSKTLEILEKSAKTKSTSLAPLQECVDSLKQEMDMLNRMIRQNSQIRNEITEMSLMDELRAVSER
ncbi:putative leucine-rich repeat-containing protein DDB_G0290503 [Culicoides brevitarsis]|uniref:putative leucine-rich repeat-containing protein DDB_G0290503 n=1 Tax=Culicoides brevitarsis TaxID=469753 RepID=UPI00307C0BE8